MVEKRERHNEKSKGFQPGLAAVEDSYLDQFDEQLEALRAELTAVKSSHFVTVSYVPAKNARRSGHLGYLAAVFELLSGRPNANSKAPRGKATLSDNYADYGHELAQGFADFDAVLDFVNPRLARSADTLEEISRDMSASLAAMDSRAERIDRTQAETRAILNQLIEGG